jgi:hypothetical protein
MLDEIRSSLSAAYPPDLVDELLGAYQEIRRLYYAGGLRLAEVEGGRFSEAAFRMLEAESTGTFTPLGRSLDTTMIQRRLEQLPHGSFPDSVRLHVPRALRVVYDIRNNRDAVHLADGIDPNLQDASLVLTTASWVLAEFVRMHHAVSADEAQAIVEQLVAREAPMIQDFAGYLKVLDPGLSASDHCLLLLYQVGAKGASFEQLSDWARPAMKANLRRTLHRLVHDLVRVHHDGERYFITRTGERHLADSGLL